MAEHQLPKLNTGVRFPSPAPMIPHEKQPCNAISYRAVFHIHIKYSSRTMPRAMRYQPKILKSRFLM